MPEEPCELLLGWLLKWDVSPAQDGGPWSGVLDKDKPRLTLTGTSYTPSAPPPMTFVPCPSRTPGFPRYGSVRGQYIEGPWHVLRRRDEWMLRTKDQVLKDMVGFVLGWKLGEKGSLWWELGSDRVLRRFDTPLLVKTLKLHRR